MNWAELPQVVQLLLALALVVALMGGLAFVLKKLGLSGPVGAAGVSKRLKVVEALPLDARRRLVILRRDDKEHLVILGPNGETVVESGFKAAKTDDQVKDKK